VADDDKPATAAADSSAAAPPPESAAATAPQPAAPQPPPPPAVHHAATAGSVAATLPPVRAATGAAAPAPAPAVILAPATTPNAAQPAANPDSPPHAAFSSESYVVPAAEPAARIVIQRRGNTQGEVNFIWWTEGGSAAPDVYYASLGARTEHLASGQERMTVYVPIISSPLRHKSTQFQVVLADATSHRANGGAQDVRATVTIEGNR